MDHARNRDIPYTQLFVKSICCGRHRRFPMMRYHGRGRTGKMKKETSRMVVVLEVKPLEDLYRLIANGKCPVGLAYVFRH